MDFHVFVFWNHGLYVSRIINKPSFKKRRRNKKLNIQLEVATIIVNYRQVG